MKKLVNLFALALVLTFGLFAGGKAEDYSLTILATNDTHGHPLAFSWSDSPYGTAQASPQAGGLPARATYFAQVKAERPNVLILDAGDFTTGLVVSNYFQAKPDVVGMNLAGYHAATLGNHEFDNDSTILAARIADATFPLVSANVYVKWSGKPLVQPYTIIELNDLKVGVIGLTTPETPVATLPANVDGLEFRDPVASVNAVLKEVRAKSDFVVVLSHLGIAGDRELAQGLKGVDLILGGHSHTPMKEAEVVNGIPIFQSFQWGVFVSRVDVEVVDGKVSSLVARPVGINARAVELAAGKEATGTLVEFNGKRYDFVDGYLPQDPEVHAALQPFADEVRVAMEQVIGNAAGTFGHTVNGLANYSRRDDSALSNMITDGLRAVSAQRIGKPVDVFLQNGGGIRATLPAGPITKSNVYTVLPFDNTIQTATITGAQLLQVLEQRALPIAVSNYTTGWDGPNGAFLQVSGMTYTIDIANKTISEVMVGGKPLDPAAKYTMATQNFMMAGGDGYTMLKGLPDTFETSVFQRDALIEWITSQSNINPLDFEDDRIKLVNTGR